jgi:hypothetical protein
MMCADGRRVPLTLPWLSCGEKNAGKAHAIDALSTLARSGSGLCTGAHARLKPNGTRRATVDIDSEPCPNNTNHVGDGCGVDDRDGGVE